MPRATNGTYSLPAGTTAVPDTVISSSAYNAATTDIASAMTDSLARDGKGGMQAALDMGSHRINNVTDPNVAQDAATKAYVDANFTYSTILPQGRLTLTSQTPVLSADVTGTANVYYTPYFGTRIPIYDGSRFVVNTFSELTLALDSNSAHTGYQQADKNFDLYVILDSSTIRLGTGPAWTSDTARGSGAGTTELSRISGLLVNANVINIRYGANAGDLVSVPAFRATLVGTLRTSADGQTVMIFFPNAAAGGSHPRLLVCNEYNQVMFSAICKDSATSWNYALAAVRSAHGSNDMRINFIQSTAKQAIYAVYNDVVNAHPTGAASVCCALDATNTMLQNGQTNGTLVNANIADTEATITGTLSLPGQLGYHYIQAVEYTNAVSCGFSGADGSSIGIQSGMIAHIWC